MLAEDRIEVEDLLRCFYRLVDSGKADQTSALFTADAKLTFGPGAPNPGSIEGAGIAAAMQARGRMNGVVTRHVLTNLAFEQSGPDEISVYSLLTLYRYDGALAADALPDTYPASIADVFERVVRTGDGWRICERTINPVFNRPVARR